MRHITKGLALAASLAFVGSAASALSITNAGATTTMGFTTNFGTPKSLTVDFDWANVSFGGSEGGAFIDFTTNTQTVVSFDSYAPDGDTGKISKWVMFDITAGTKAITDAGATTGCWSVPLPELRGFCNRITGATTTGVEDVLRPVPGKTVFSFGPGTYRLGLFENFKPATGTASFTVTAVPLPASGLMLIGALGGIGGLAARSRRKKA